MHTTEITNKTGLVEELFKIGAHFGYSKSRRHPSVKSFIFGAKSSFEIIDLEKSVDMLASVLGFIETLAKDKKQILFVSSKQEAVRAIKENAEKIDAPYVAGRWIGGSLTNFGEIRKRVERMQKLQEEREKGLLAKYTKKERLLIDRQIENLESRFSGLVSMTKKPAALFVIDPKHEEIAVHEARLMGIPVIALCGSDCDISKIEHPIVANDSLAKSIEFFVSKAVETYKNAAK